MKFADVVPVRRMPADRPWLTYAIPENMNVVPGQAVTVPLRGQPILGIVYKIHQNAPQMSTQKISAIHMSSPMMSAWQRRVGEVMAEIGSTSLGDVLWRVIPKLTIKKLLTSMTGTLVEKTPVSVQPTSSIWYRERQAALEKISSIVRTSAEKQFAIITPTADDALEIVARLEQQGRTAIHLDGQTPPTVYAMWYNRVRNDEPLVVVGGLSALALPYPQPPQIIFDQEEHHAHKQTAQFPYYDTRAVIKALGVTMTITTPAPSLTYYHRQQPTRLPAPAGRHLFSLHGPRAAALMTQATLDEIDSTVGAGKKVVCISPRRGFASATVCRACGTSLACPKCGRSAAIFRGPSDEARCHACQTNIPLRTSCQKCGATDWSFQGYGIEQTVSSLKQLRPDLVVTPVVRHDVTADIAVDTYQAYRQLRRIDQLGLVVVISGDSLLNLPDYSVAERAWQYLARLQAEVPTAALVVQTFEPEALFWQRWLHGDDAAWYQDELQQRQRLHVPPFTTQWIAHLRGDKKTVDLKIAEISGRYQNLSLRMLPPQPKSPSNHRLLLSFEQTGQAATLPWVELFPLPWHLDRYPASWLD